MTLSLRDLRVDRQWGKFSSRRHLNTVPMVGAKRLALAGVFSQASTKHVLILKSFRSSLETECANVLQMTGSDNHSRRKQD